MDNDTPDFFQTSSWRDLFFRFKSGVSDLSLACRQNESGASLFLLSFYLEKNNINSDIFHIFAGIFHILLAMQDFDITL